MNEHIRWTVIFMMFWVATVVFRLGYADDVTDWLVWWLSLGVAFGFPVAIGYNIAMYRFYNQTHRITFVDEDEAEKSNE